MDTNRRLTERELAALAASAMGRKGGMAGTGESKRRGDRSYYQRIVNKRWQRARKGGSK